MAPSSRTGGGLPSSRTARIPDDASDLLWRGLQYALRDDVPVKVLKAWLRLAVRWQFAPDFSERA